MNGQDCAGHGAMDRHIGSLASLLGLIDNQEVDTPQESGQLAVAIDFMQQGTQRDGHTIGSGITNEFGGLGTTFDVSPI